MTVIHFKCERDSGGFLKNLSCSDAKKSIYRSGNWDMTAEQAAALIGGWLYLHGTKKTVSEFGGRVVGFEPLPTQEETASKVVLVVESRAEGRNQRWRGKATGSAPSGGPVEASLPHEM